MKTVKFIVEKSETGYAAYAENFEKYPVTTVADTLEELKENLVQALNTWLEFQEKPLVGKAQIAVKLDLKQFFDFYKEINAKSLSKRAGIQPTLLSDYISGRKTPSPKQTARILEGVRSLGRELSELEFA